MLLRLLNAVVLTCALLPFVSHGSSEPSASGARSTDGTLAATAWQLVEIVSMNDRVDKPDDRSLYTLEFKSDDTIQVRADCYRGVGSWASDSPGQLRIDRIAATQALCPPDSLHDRYMAQFPWVRSYVIRNGHLFLATMADGSIIEFEPVELPLAATVLGEEIRTSDAGEMRDIVLSRLFDRYAEEQHIEANDAEIDAFVDNMRRGMRAAGLATEDDLTAEEAAQAKQMRRDMGRSMIRQWKLNRALYQQYGGRIIFQQLGPEPLDAYRHYLEERRSAGDFRIHEKAFDKEFWRYFTTDSMHDFYEPGSAEEKRAFTTPPWSPARR
jgi:heat shock protein HslJ